MSWLERLRSLEEKSELLEKGPAETAKSPFYSFCSASSQECENQRTGNEDPAREVTTTINADPAPSPSSATSDQTRCAHCGQGEHSGAMIVPFGTASAGHVWLHSGCWREWYAERRGEVMPDAAAEH